MSVRAVVAVVASVVIAIACGQPAGSGSAGNAASDANVAQELTTLENDWAAALVKGDPAFMEANLAAEFVGTLPNGTRQTKAQSIEMLRAGDYKVESMTLDNIKVQTFGDTALVTYGENEKSAYRGFDGSGRTVWTDTLRLIRRNAKWEVLASHGTQDAANAK